MDTIKRIHLDMVALHFSTWCGSACRFCYFTNPMQVRTPPTPIGTIRKILEKLANDEVKEVLFLGGDPVLHPHFMESLEIAKSLGLTTTVLSNSWTIAPPEKLRIALSYIDYCEATILGATSQIHNDLTQRKNSFECLIQNLQTVAENGKTLGICVNVIPQNVEQIYEIVDRIQNQYQIPVRSLMVQRIIPSGAACQTAQSFSLSLEDANQMMKQIDGVVTKLGIPVLFEDPIPWCTVASEYHRYLSRCEWGFTKGSISPTGLLNRCAADDHYRLGSIWDGNLQDIWKNHPILKSFRSKDYLPEECQTCELLEYCGGGCCQSCSTEKDHGTDYLYYLKTE